MYCEKMHVQNAFTLLVLWSQARQALAGKLGVRNLGSSHTRVNIIDLVLSMLLIYSFHSLLIIINTIYWLMVYVTENEHRTIILKWTSFHSQKYINLWNLINAQRFNILDLSTLYITMPFFIIIFCVTYIIQKVCAHCPDVLISLLFWYFADAYCV